MNDPVKMRRHPRVLDKHIGHVVGRIRSFSALEKQLRELRSRCLATNSTGACEILQALGGNDRNSEVPHGT